MTKVQSWTMATISAAALVARGGKRGYRVRGSSQAAARAEGAGNFGQDGSRA